MNTTLVITTINKPNINIKKFSKGSFKKKWNFIIIGDKKSPKKFKLDYGQYFNLKAQKKVNLKFAKICPINNYARKNIGYLLAFRNNSEIIIETDDDNCPKENFFLSRNLLHKPYEIKNRSWVNIYDLFIFKKNKLIWPRGIPLDEIHSNKIRTKKMVKEEKFYLQQGVCEKNPDVDAIFRLINKDINVKFKKNLIVSLGKSLSTFNSQNTTWHKEIFPLMYLPVTCTMRCTDIWRSLVALNILKKDRKKILFHGTDMFQNRNYHDLNKDFKQEIPMYLLNKKIFKTLAEIKLKPGSTNYDHNLILSYQALIKKGFVQQKEMFYLKAWLADIKT
jgi:hypothetical protein